VAEFKKSFFDFEITALETIFEIFQLFKIIAFFGGFGFRYNKIFIVIITWGLRGDQHLVLKMAFASVTAFPGEVEIPAHRALVVFG